MRFYKGAHDYLLKASREKNIEDQHLYLVAEVDNEHDICAVMLHNGKQKLGSVTAAAAPAIKRLLMEWKAEAKGAGDVVVCSMQKVWDVKNFTYRGAITVHGKYRVNEQLAHAFAHYRKD